MSIGDDLDFVPLHSTPHMLVAGIYLYGERIGTETVVYPKSIANPFVPPIYQYLWDAKEQPYGTPPVGDSPLVLAPRQDERGVGCMIPGWSTIEGLVQALEMEAEEC